MDKLNYQGPGRYRHFKGGIYSVIGIALQEGTLQQAVIYRPFEGWPADVPQADFWTRSLESFNNNVKASLVDPEDPGLIPRFEKL